MSALLDYDLRPLTRAFAHENRRHGQSRLRNVCRGHVTTEPEDFAPAPDRGVGATRKFGPYVGSFRIAHFTDMPWMAW